MNRPGHLLQTLLHDIGLVHISRFTYLSLPVLIIALFLWPSTGWLWAWALAAHLLLIVSLSVLRISIGNLNHLLSHVGEDLSKHDVMNFCDHSLGDMELSLLKLLRNVERKHARYNDTLKEMEFSANELKINAEKLAENTQTQSHATHSTAAAITEISQSIDDVTHRVQQTSHAAEIANQKSEKGRMLIARSRKEVEEVADLAQQTNALMQQLDSGSKRVADMSKVIEEIAQKTNLLALNAAIEAARAGEKGRGFAVVASEVRELANQSLDSTDKISASIIEVHRDMDKVVESMNAVLQRVTNCINDTLEAEAELQAITHHSQQVHEEVDAIAVAIHQQAQASREISTHIEQVASSAEDNTHMAQQTASVSHHLYGLTQPVQ